MDLDLLDLECQLIALVKAHPCLYDAYHIDFKSNFKKDITWTEIASRLQITVDECRRRWKNMKDYFRKLHKWETTTFEDGEPPRRKWRHMHALSFLADFPPPTKLNESTSSNTSGQHLNASWVAQNILEALPDAEEEPKKEVAPTIKLEPDYDIDVELEAPPEPLRTTNTPKPDFFVQEVPSDHWRKFFDSITAQIERSSLSKRQELILQRKISNLVYYELEKWNSSDP